MGFGVAVRVARRPFYRDSSLVEAEGEWEVYHCTHQGSGAFDLNGSSNQECGTFGALHPLCSHCIAHP